jgi:hypothetical protein
VAIDGVLIDEWINYYLYAPIVTTSNCSAIDDLHSLQIATETAKPFPASCVSNSLSLARAYNSGDSSDSRDHVITVRRISRN